MGVDAVTSNRTPPPPPRKDPPPKENSDAVDRKAQEARAAEKAADREKSPAEISGEDSKGSLAVA